MSTPGAHFQLEVEQAKAIATAVGSVRGVAGLNRGQFGEVSLLFPRQRVGGIRHLDVRDDTKIETHVVVDISAEIPLQSIADAVRTAAFGACPDLTRVDVVFADAVTS